MKIIRPRVSIHLLTNIKSLVLEKFDIYGCEIYYLINGTILIEFEGFTPMNLDKYRDMRFIFDGDKFIEDIGELVSYKDNTVSDYILNLLNG